MPELSIVMPCLNEEETLPAAVEQLNQVIAQASLNVELIILDDESTDDTLHVASGLIEQYPSLHVRVFHRVRRRRGFGAIARYGVAHATGRYCAFVSADGLDPVELLPEFVKRLRAGTQHVQCSRYIRPEDAQTVSRKYRLYQSIYRRLIQTLLGQEIKDSTYGFRAFDRVYVQALGITSNRFNLCPEITFKVLLSGGKTEYVPGHPFLPYKGGGSAKFELPHESWGYLYVLLRAWLHRFGLYWF
jgi:glycosyltransferase involved in cell wall biosynthesis